MISLFDSNLPVEGRGSLRLLVKQGSRKRWRWYLYSMHPKPGELEAAGPVHGFDTKEEAIAHARHTRSLRWTCQ